MTSVKAYPYSTPIGFLYAAFTDSGLSYLSLDPLKGSGDALHSTDHPALEKWLEIYFSGRDPGPSPIDLDMSGLSPFRRDIYHTLMRVRFGEVVTYSELGAIAGHPGSARAVGNAVGANPFFLIVPCHRVVASGSGGSLSLGGFSAGRAIKRYLIKNEGITCL